MLVNKKCVSFVLVFLFLAAALLGGYTAAEETSGAQESPAADPDTAVEDAPRSPDEELKAQILENYTMTKGFHETETINWGYWLYDPNLPDQTESLPLVVYLHGSRGAGQNPDLLIRYDRGLGRFIDEGLIAVNALLFLPQSETAWESGYDELAELIIWAVEEFGADPERVCLVGCSAGGIGCFEMLLRYPELFCCGVPIGASTNPRAVAGIKTPLRIYHGVRDFNMGFSVVEANKLINQNGGHSELIMMKNTRHNEQLVLYDDSWGLWDWVLAQGSAA